MNERQPNKRGLYAPCADTHGVHLLERHSCGHTHVWNISGLQDPENVKLAEGEHIFKDESVSFKSSYNNFDAVITETYCGWTDNGRKFVNRFEFKIKDGKVFRWGEIDYAKAKTLKKAYRKMIYGD